MPNVSALHIPLCTHVNSLFYHTLDLIVLSSKPTLTLSSEAGVLKLQEIRDGEIEAVTTKDLRAKGAFPMNFSDLKSRGFPVACFEAAKICRRSVWPAPGERLPISLVQVNFIQGGMILAWNLLHMFGDSVTFFVWAQVWAEECRRAQGLEISDPVDFTNQMLSDRAQLMGPSGKNAGHHENHPEYLVLPCMSCSSVLLIVLEHYILFKSSLELTTDLAFQSHSHSSGGSPQDGFQYSPRPSVSLLTRGPDSIEGRCIANPCHSAWQGNSEMDFY